MRVSIWLNRRHVGKIAFLLGCALLTGVILYAQQQPQQPATPPPPQQQTQTPQSQPPIAVEVKVVNVLATVRDKKGALVTNLGKDDFVIDEEGRTQTITYFARDTDQPLRLGLLVDTSGSLRTVLSDERDASQAFLDDILRPDKDKAFLIHFDREVELLQDLTNSRDKLQKALNEMNEPQFAQPNQSPNQNPQGGGYPQGGGIQGAAGAGAEAATQAEERCSTTPSTWRRRTSSRKNRAARR